ncbi:hypothetical protein [Streptomyces vinaceus]|uniref:hypothetical protein n=1 Tax=Streptomyces vinaceus TaxID=1960 RepID=UPI0036C3AA69
MADQSGGNSAQGWRRAVEKVERGIQGGETEPAPVQAPVPVVPEAREEAVLPAAGHVPNPHAPDALPAPTKAPEDLSAPGAEAPRWTTLVRKEARLRQDQLDGLARLRRRVMAARTDRTEVITDNTLIRVAVDYLLMLGEVRLHGSTEEELRLSLIRLRGRRPNPPE